MHVSLDLIDPPPLQLRATIDSLAIQDLADSMARVGQLQAIRLRPTADRYTIQAGHRRFLAAQILGWRTIRAELANPDDAGDSAAALHENLFRVNLTPIEEAGVCEELTTREQLDVAGIARRLRHTEEWVRQRLGLLAYPDDVLTAIHDGILSLVAARHVAPIDDEGYRGTVLDAARSHGMTERHAMSWKAQYDVYKSTRAAGGPATMPTAAEIDLELQHTVCDAHGGQVWANATKLVRICFDCWQAIQAANRSLPPAG